MRIAIIQDTLSAYNVPLFHEVALRAESVTVFSRASEMAKWLETGGVESGAVAFNHHVFPSALTGGRRQLTPASELIESVLKSHPDVVFIDGLSSAGTAASLIVRTGRPGTPIVWWSLGALPRRGRTPRRFLGDALQRWCVHRCAIVLSYGMHGAAYFESIGVPRERIVVGYNTIDERAVQRDLARLAPETARLRGELVRPGERVIVFCGTLKAGKGVDVLLRALASILGRSPKPTIRLILIGDGPMRPELEALAAGLRIQGSVSFVGEQRRLVSAYMMLAEFAVLPGLGGLAINHAFAHGLPVICGPADGTERDLVSDGVTGRLLPSIDRASLAEAIVDTLASPEDVRRMGLAARELVLGAFSIERYADRVVEASEKAVTASHRR